MGTPVAGKTKTKVLLLLALHAALLHGAGGVIKCGKAVGVEPEPCPDETFKCCRRNACSKVCTANEGTGEHDKCTPEFGQKCCVSKYNDGYSKVFNIERCPKRALLSCPKEVAKKPETVNCPGERGECCAMDGLSKSKCAKGSRCAKRDVCQPSFQEKCCLGKHGNTVTVVSDLFDCPARPAPPPPIRCPKEVAEKPETEKCSGVRGECCVMDGLGKSKCAKGSRCAERDVCQPGADEKCCLGKHGTLKVEDSMFKCPAPPAPLSCPKEVAEKPEMEDCPGAPGECCVMDGLGKSKCAKGKRCAKRDVCQPGDGQQCCLGKQGKTVTAVNAVFPCPAPPPPLRCPKEVAKKPKTEDCPGDRGECCVMEGPGKSKCAKGTQCAKRDVCKPGPLMKCCLGKHGKKVAAVSVVHNCPAAPRPLRCPLEVAKKPKRTKCSPFHDRCCVMDGSGKSQCARGQLCKAQGEDACRPDARHKCCLNAKGTAVGLVRRRKGCVSSESAAHGPGLRLLAVATLLLLLPH